jgi:Holin of 3TMs, for gene-transfer release
MIPLTAIMSIGEKVLDRVLPDPQAKAQALAELTKLQNEGKLAELNADNVEAQEISKRWDADMKSDSWLSKNVRPMTLVALLVAYFIFATASAFGIEVTQAYVELLGQMIMLIVSAYFGGRTLEKIMDKKGK